MSAQMSRRARRARQRRQEIVKAAVRVFSRKGFDRATTREIAEEADIAEGTIYKYFDTKRDLLMSIVAEAAPAFYEEAHPFESTESSREELVSSFDHALAFVTENKETLTILVGEMWHDAEIRDEWLVKGGQDLVNGVTEKLAALAQQGALRDIDPGLASRLFLSAGAGLLLPILMGTIDVRDPEARRTLATEMIDMLMFGIWRRDPREQA